jgi:hypothetical protein
MQEQAHDHPQPVLAADPTAALVELNRQVMAFHAFPDTLSADSRTGDYGLNFFGYAYNAATYLVQHPDFGWVAFGGNVAVSGNTITVTPLDAFRRRVYLASQGLWLTLDATSGAVRVGLAQHTSHTPSARLRVEQPASVSNPYTLRETYTTERGASVIPLGVGTTCSRKPYIWRWWILDKSRRRQ